MEQNILLERLKQVELDLLKQFITVCDKLNLKYYVVGGTLLGAVRHKGFIPWDDDIDVTMPRPDYEKFMEHAQGILEEKYFLQNYNTDKMFPRFCAKLRNSETAFIEDCYVDTNMNQGVYIDIFPFDGMPDDIEKCKNHIDKCEKLIGKPLYVNNLNNKKIDYFRCDNAILYRLKMLKKYIYKRFVNLEKYVEKSRKKLNEEVLKYNYSDSKYVCNIFGRWGYREIVEKDVLGEGVMLPFETLMVNAPTKYDVYLTALYDDYMQLPPEDKRHSGHDLTVIDVDKSYKEYMK